MDWTHDVCLSCDNQTQDGQKFCSQACRLADMERAGCSEPPTPASLPNNTSSWESWQMSSSKTNTSRQHHLQLAPPVNFSAYRQSSSLESPPSSPRTRPVPQSTSYFTHHTTTSTSSQPKGRGLTLSPSRSSLSSVSSSGSALSSPGLSEETMNQLRDYSGAFDQTRDWKRRVTFG
jgi:hypothetical protein